MALTATVHATKPVVGAETGLWGGEINSDFDYFDRSINGIVTVNVPDANVVLVADGTSGDQSNYAILQFTGALTADRTVTLPANTKLGWAINATTGGHNVILKNASGPTLSINPGVWVQFWSSGSSVGAIPEDAHVANVATTTAQIGTLSNANAGTGCLVVESGISASTPAIWAQNHFNAPSAVSVIVRNDRIDGVAVAFTSGTSVVGTITQNGVITSYNTTSDARLKNTFGEANVGVLIDAVTVHDAEFKARPGARLPMFLAHELQEVCPWAVLGEKDAVYPDGSVKAQQVNNSGLVALLWAELRTVRKRLAVLESGFVRQP